MALPQVHAADALSHGRSKSLAGEPRRQPLVQWQLPKHPLCGGGGRRNMCC